MIKKILILDEYYFDVSTPERQNAVSFSIVKFRNKTGFYKASIPEPVKPRFPDPGSRARTRSVVRGRAYSQWREYHRLEAEYLAEKELLEFLVRVLEEEKIELAFEFLTRRKELNGEDFQIVEVLDGFNLEVGE